jgi:hypothetical protein
VKETGSDSEPRDFDAERSNSSASGSTVLATATEVATSFEGPEARFGDREGSGFETGVLRVFPRISDFLSILFNPRDCLLASLSALGSKLDEGAGVLRLSGRPMCGSGPRENSGVATSSLPPFFDRGVRSLTRRVRDGSMGRTSVSSSSCNSVVATYLCVTSGREVDGWRGLYDMVKTSEWADQMRENVLPIAPADTVNGRALFSLPFHSPCDYLSENTSILRTRDLAGLGRDSDWRYFKAGSGH